VGNGVRRGAIPIVRVSSKANTRVDTLHDSGRGAVMKNRWNSRVRITSGIVGTCGAAKDFMCPDGAADVVATAIKIDPAPQEKLRRLGMRTRGNCGFWLRGLGPEACVFRNFRNPAIEMGKETGQKLAQRAAHGEKLNRQAFFNWTGESVASGFGHAAGV